MNILLKTALFSGAMLFAVQSMAGTIKSDTTRVGRDARKVGHTVKRVGQKTADAASNTAANVDSRIVDRKYHEKRGPHGETVYITKHDHYYYINKKGHRVYITKAQMHDEKED
ncbi:MAG TPA: hypothetical protein VHB54_21765 [Mucilaginibacter sp.]|nr:hypothetical protein [Mucilaginibacter sp.]